MTTSEIEQLILSGMLKGHSMYQIAQEIASRLHERASNDVSPLRVHSFLGSP